MTEACKHIKLQVEQDILQHGQSVSIIRHFPLHHALPNCSGRIILCVQERSRFIHGERLETFDGCLGLATAFSGDSSIPAIISHGTVRLRRAKEVLILLPRGILTMSTSRQSQRIITARLWHGKTGRHIAFLGKHG